MMHRQFERVGRIHADGLSLFRPLLEGITRERLRSHGHHRPRIVRTTALNRAAAHRLDQRFDFKQLRRSHTRGRDGEIVCPDLGRLPRFSGTHREGKSPTAGRRAGNDTGHGIESSFRRATGLRLPQ